MNCPLLIYRGAAEAREADELTERVNGAGLAVHRDIGRGLLESADPASPGLRS